MVNRGTIRRAMSEIPSFGEQLRQARAEAKMSQDLLCARTQLAKSVIQRLETKGAVPTVPTLMKLAHVLKATFEFDYYGMKMVFKRELK